MQATSTEGMVTVAVFHTFGPNHVTSQFVLYIIRYKKIVMHTKIPKFKKNVPKIQNGCHKKSIWL